jgi:hypothetical protein
VGPRVQPRALMQIVKKGCEERSKFPIPPALSGVASGYLLAGGNTKICVSASSSGAPALGRPRGLQPLVLERNECRCLRGMREVPGKEEGCQGVGQKRALFADLGRRKEQRQRGEGVVHMPDAACRMPVHDCAHRCAPVIPSAGIWTRTPGAG